MRNHVCHRTDLQKRFPDVSRALFATVWKWFVVMIYAISSWMMSKDLWLGSTTGQVTRAGWWRGLPRVRAWVGKFPPARNPRPRARVRGQARVFFSSITQSPPTPTPHSRPSNFLWTSLTASEPLSRRFQNQQLPEFPCSSSRVIPQDLKSPTPRSSGCKSPLAHPDLHGSATINKLAKAINDQRSTINEQARNQQSCRVASFFKLPVF
jgi:hypothetical protein